MEQSIKKVNTEIIESLFWDVDFCTLDLKKYKNFVIERLLQFGRPEHVRWVLDFYEKEDIVETIKKSRKISKKTANFWALHYEISREEIKCFNMPLLQPCFY
jgi:hypothetical protein